MTAPDDVYTHGHEEAVLRSHRWRTVENSAAYLLPHITETSRILDVGCGPGTITLDLARRAGAGRVVGTDRSEAVVEEARAAAARTGLTNVELTVGDVYALDHAAGSFDVVHAHQVLQHLTDPVAALREMGRVCRPGGLVAVRDADYSAFTWSPAVPELDDWLDLYREVARGNAAEPDAGRHLKGWALAAGLEVVSSTAGAWCFSTADDVAWWGSTWAERVLTSGLAEQALERGLACAADLDRLAAGWRRWAAAPDAWFAVLHGELLCTPKAVG
ncbi:methyltransferase domain-containing protein [Phycicoccus sp. HDW14]|uniref:methyltransferase domain-containing protein n=1 Tax=Phycicoccus sp. HDW14 TaxID=2714941 RepID=UPI00140B8F08|nr:methyltransferase domain-containing protein [Phycicoccus sp. HDW14]QIM21573.1 methyltransferase domain-containing protein [Phycicoccus sp. HDW14]